jgi:hypothetical protein
MTLRFKTLLLLMVCAAPLMRAGAQTTSVTFQVIDGDSQTWNNGTWTATLYSPPGVPQGNYVILGGSTPVPNQQQSGTLDASGNGSLTVTPNTSIAPSGTQWQFTFTPQATPANTYQQSYAISGASQVLSVAPPAIRVSVASPQTRATAYTDLEVTGASVGSLYYNLISTNYRVCETTVGPACTAWIPITSGIATGLANAGNTVTLSSNGIIMSSVNGSFCFIRIFVECIDAVNNEWTLGGGIAANWEVENSSFNAYLRNPLGGSQITIHGNPVDVESPNTVIGATAGAFGTQWQFDSNGYFSPVPQGLLDIGVDPARPRDIRFFRSLRADPQSDSVFSLTLSAQTSKTFTFSNLGYTSAPQCVATPQFDVGTGVRYWITVSVVSAEIITSSVVTGTFDFFCIPPATGP